MKITQSIFFLAAAMSLASCSSDDVFSYERVDAAHDAIVLRAGVSEGGVGVATRAIDDRHDKHVLFTQGTKLALQLNGQWNSNTVIQPTTGITGTESATDSRHNNLALSPDLFWNDYGVADPSNAAGRAAGLTIYGAAVDGVTTAPEVTNWGALSWTLPTDQTAGWAASDLLTSNNVRPTDAALDGSGRTGDGTYKFDDFMGTSHNTPSNIIEFTHAMAKVTVVLTAGEGFPEGKFESNPTVTLTAFKYTGSVSIPGKTSTPTDEKSNINMHLASGGAAHTATFDALVYPGNVFTDATEILSLTADGNTFEITAKKINDAIRAAIANSSISYPATGTDVSFKQGWNYKILVTVNKTSTHVTATIVDWNEVTAEEEAPKINVNKTYGHEPGTDFAKGFDLYRSTTFTGSYLGTGDHAVVSYADSKYTMTPQLYWPNHQTHYFFRGIWPLVGSKDSSDEQLGPTSAQVKANTIDVENVAYKQGYYPSDLMIGRPLNAAETATDEACKVHSGTQGICATEGDVRMNFRYMMSQVKVELSSSNPTDKDYIAFDANTKVEIIGGYKEGAIKLSDCTSDFTGKSVVPYTLHNAAATDYDSYHDAIIPQTLTDGLKFRITVTNDDGTTDVYECAVKDIKVSENSAAPALISAWQSGKIYTYRLKVTKTAVNVTATLTDWVNVEASENVWF